MLPLSISPKWRTQEPFSHLIDGTFQPIASAGTARSGSCRNSWRNSPHKGAARHLFDGSSWHSIHTDFLSMTYVWVRPDSVTPGPTRQATRFTLTTNQQTSKLVFMKTTLDLPADLVRQVKLEALNEGKKLKDAVADLLRRGLS